MRDIPEGSIEYVILVSRWNLKEEEKFARYTGTQKLPALRPAEQAEIAVGEFRIGGHSHGTSSRHEDKPAGWKLVVLQAGRKVEFRTPTSFEMMSSKAEAVR